jgi:hypothetical protein
LACKTKQQNNKQLFDKTTMATSTRTKAHTAALVTTGPGGDPGDGSGNDSPTNGGGAGGNNGGGAGGNNGGGGNNGPGENGGGGGAGGGGGGNPPALAQPALPPSLVQNQPFHDLLHFGFDATTAFYLKRQVGHDIDTFKKFPFLRNASDDVTALMGRKKYPVGHDMELTISAVYGLWGVRAWINYSVASQSDLDPNLLDNDQLELWELYTTKMFNRVCTTPEVPMKFKTDEAVLESN